MKTSQATRHARAGLIAGVTTAILAFASIGGVAHAQQGSALGTNSGTNSGTIEPDGTVIVPSFALPPSMYMSEAASKALPRKPTDPEEMMFRALAAGKAGEMRKRMPEFMAARFKHLTELYPVTMRTTTLAGVPAVYATPVKPIPSRNKRKIMLNLPGGGFVMGAADGTGMLESIPLAAMAQVEIVSITYRQAPETIDARWGGDSRAWGQQLQALPPRADNRRSYFSADDINNPLASPILTPDVLKRFPPTLVITGTRAFEMSAAVNTHRELVKAGVAAELHMWDGMYHAFFYNIDWPESREAFDVMAHFFQKHLKLEK